MEHIKAIYFERHLYKFEDIWTDQKYALRNINDLNGFLCCLCCIIPFGVCKACIMCVLHSIILIPFILIVSIILFPYQLITIYITTLSTNLLGPKIKCILFLTNPLLYTIFITFYLIFAILSCIYFSFYAAFKVTLSDHYYVFGGYIDPIKVLLSNILIYLSNNTKEFKNYCKNITNYEIRQDEGDAIWDISLISWCNTLMSIIMTILAVLFIMLFVFVEVVLYLIPFSLHLMIHLYVFKFLKYFFQTMIIKQPCLALICCPFIIFPILLIPIFAVLYLLLYVWLYSAFFNKAIIMQAFIDNSFDCLQQCSYIINTICLYNNYLFQYSFQSCWKCRCCYTQQHVEDDGYDLETQKTKKMKNVPDDEYNRYEIKFRQLSAVFWETKNNGDLVTFGKGNRQEQKEQKRREDMERERYQRQQMNIELWTVPKIGKKSNGKQLKKCNKKERHGQNKKEKSNLKARHKRVDSDSFAFEEKSKNGKKLNKKNKYEHIGMRMVDEEEVTDSEELNVLMPHDTNKQIGFSYPRGI